MSTTHDDHLAQIQKRRDMANAFAKVIPLKSEISKMKFEDVFYILIRKDILEFTLSLLHLTCAHLKVQVPSLSDRKTHIFLCAYLIVGFTDRFFENRSQPEDTVLFEKASEMLVEFERVMAAWRDEKEIACTTFCVMYADTCHAYDQFMEKYVVSIIDDTIEKLYQNYRKLANAHIDGMSMDDQEKLENDIIRLRRLISVNPSGKGALMGLRAGLEANGVPVPEL